MEIILIHAFILIVIYSCICVIASNYYIEWLESSEQLNGIHIVINEHNLLTFARRFPRHTLLCMIVSPFTLLYILAWKLGFIIYKLKIKGKYEDRFAPWVI